MTATPIQEAALVQETNLASVQTFETRDGELYRLDDLLLAYQNALDNLQSSSLERLSRNIDYGALSSRILESRRFALEIQRAANRDEIFNQLCEVLAENSILAMRMADRFSSILNDRINAGVAHISEARDQRIIRHIQDKISQEYAERLADASNLSSAVQTLLRAGLTETIAEVARQNEATLIAQFSERMQQLEATASNAQLALQQVLLAFRHLPAEQRQQLEAAGRCRIPTSLDLSQDERIEREARVPHLTLRHRMGLLDRGGRRLIAQMPRKFGHWILPNVPKLADRAPGDKVFFHLGNAIAVPSWEVIDRNGNLYERWHPLWPLLPCDLLYHFTPEIMQNCPFGEHYRRHFKVGTLSHYQGVLFPVDASGAEIAITRELFNQWLSTVPGVHAPLGVLMEKLHEHFSPSPLTALAQASQEQEQVVVDTPAPEAA